MNDAPPPLHSPAPQAAYQSPPKSGCGKSGFGCGIGCLVMLVVLVVGSYFAFVALKNKATELVAEYTSDQPVRFEAPQVSQAEIDGAAAKIEAFANGLKEGGTPVPLYLTAEEMNALLFYHADLKQLAGAGNVSIENDQLRARVSIKLDDIDIPVRFLADAVDGRYFNGEATLSLGMSVGRPALYIEGLEVNNFALPQQFLGELRNKNLLEEIKNNPEAEEFFGKVEDMGIEGNQLYIVPKGAR